MTETNEQNSRPFCLDFTDARKEVFESINSAMRAHRVPFFLMEGILVEALRQVQDGAKLEIQAARQTESKSEVKTREQNN